MNLSSIKLLYKTLSLLLLLTVFSPIGNAKGQEYSTSTEVPNGVEMADTMRSNGKIYVVVAVILSIFGGMVFYMVSIDRKISKMEREEKI